MFAKHRGPPERTLGTDLLSPADHDGAGDRAPAFSRVSERLSRFARNVIVLTSGMGVKRRRVVMQQLENIGAATDERVVSARRNWWTP
jgi:hypothetical protein